MLTLYITSGPYTEWGLCCSDLTRLHEDHTDNADHEKLKDGDGVTFDGLLFMKCFTKSVQIMFTMSVIKSWDKRKTDRQALVVRCWISKKEP